MESNIKRKLAAIMFTDIANFTALSAKDENHALKLLDKQEEILFPIIKEFNGVLHKKIGDGLLYTFSTVTEAIKCAIQIQQKTKEIKDLNLRIGIHQGEVTLRDGDVLGDDVNVASRIEAFSPIGGIAISGKVQQDISSLPEYKTKFIDSPDLKGVIQEVKIYAIISHDLPEINTDQISAKLNKTEATSKFNIFAITGTIVTIVGIIFWFSVGFLGISYGDADETPSVGIMLMENIGDDEDDFWARGMTEDLIIKVASSGNIRIPSIKEIINVDMDETFEKIANRLNVKYILTSSLYKENGKFKLRSQLINTETGLTEYANNWVEANDNVSTIVSTLASQMLKIISPKATFKSEDNVIDSESYTLYMKAKSYDKENGNRYIDLSEDELNTVRELLEKSIALDSNNVDAQIQFARSHYYHGNFDIAIPILKKLINTCKKTNQQKLLGRVYRNLGNVLFFKWSNGKGDYSELPSLDNQKMAAKIAKENNDIDGYKHAMNNIIGSFSWVRDSEASIDSAHFYTDQMLDFAKEKNSKELEAHAYYKLGAFYQHSETHVNNSESSYYLKKAYELSKDLSNSFQITCLKALSSLSFKNSDYYGQIEYLEKTNILATQSHSNLEIASSFYTLGLSHSFPICNYKKSEEMLNKALEYKSKINDFSWYEHNIYRTLGWLNLSQGNFEKGLDNFILMEDLQASNRMSDWSVFQTHQALAISYYLLKDYDKSKIYFDKAIFLMNASNAVSDNIGLATFYFLNEFKLGNYNKITDSVLNPVHSKGVHVPLDNWIAHYIDEIPENEIMNRDPHGWIDIYYNIYMIYNLTGNDERANNYINLCYNDIMHVASKLRKEDRNNFLNNHIIISKVISIWKEFNS